MRDVNMGGKEAGMLDRRKLLIGGGFLLTAGIAVAREPRTVMNLLGNRKLESIVPQRIGQWEFYSNSGLVVPPQDQLSQQLYSQVLTRVYVAPDLPPIMLLIAQGGGQTGVIQIHRPEICYPAGGFTLSNEAVNQIDLRGGQLDTVAFTAVADTRTEQLIYWSRVGYDLPSTWAAQRWSVVDANLRGEIPDAVLVRMSVLSSDRQASMGLLDRFAKDLLAVVDKQTRNFLVGPGLA